MSEYDDIHELYYMLKTLSESSFPKKCASCGSVFNTPEEFFARTIQIGKSTGVKQALDDNGQTILEFFRNCPCGSTLMEEFQNRRNQSETGKIKRDEFDKILEILMNNGIPKDRGRLEILRYIRGESGTVIDGLLYDKHLLEQISQFFT